MIWTQIEKAWPRFRVDAKLRWNKLSEQQLDAIAGRRAVLAGRIGDAYALSPEDAEKELTRWQDSLTEDPSLQGRQR